MDARESLKSRALVVLLVIPIMCVFLGAGDSSAQDTTVFVDDFESYPVQTFARGCGDMTESAWRWESHHYHACYSAGWGVEYAQPPTNTTSTDKKLRLWGGVPFGGGGDCTAAISDGQFEEFTDYTVTAVVSPIRVVNGIGICKRGTAGIAGRVQGTSTFCTGYLLALSLNNGEALCGDESFLELYSNDRGPGCNGSESMTLLASEQVDISADLGGNFAPDQQYVMKLCFSGSDIYGGVWTLQEWEAGEGAPFVEVNASDDTYSSGTVGLYQGSTHTNFDNVVVTLGGECIAAQPAAMEADLNFDPNTLNTKSNGKYVTCYIELPPDYDPSDIDVATVMLNDVVPAELKPTNVGDNDGDGVEDLMVKFSRSAVVDVLTGAGVPSALGASGAGGTFGVWGSADAGGTSGGGEFSWDNAVDRSGAFEGGRSALGGSSSGSRYYGNADASGTSGGGEFSWGSAADHSGTSGGGEFSWGSAADHSGTSGGGEFSWSGASDHGDSVEVWVTGQLTDGTAFVGKDTVRVTSPGNSAESAGGSANASNINVTPSPVKGRARVDFEVVVEGHVRLCVFDAAGRRVATLVSGNRGVGTYDVTWDRTTNDGRRVGPGVYFVRLDQPGNTSVQKMMLVKE